MNTQQTKNIIQQLWHVDTNLGEPIVYAILDGSRNKKIHPMLCESQLRYSCLYEGRLNYELTLAAPYIVRLEKDNHFTHELIHQGWGNSWGIYAITHTPATLVGVRRNCRKIAYITDSKNKKYVFRYYDPRVFKVYLPTCNALEASKVFGPITEYVIESHTPDKPHRFIQTSQGAKDIGQANFNLNTIKDIKINPSQNTPQFNILKIRDHQMSALLNHALEKDFQSIKKQFINDFINNPDENLIVNNKEISLDIFLRCCLNEALNFKIEDQYSIYSFFHLTYKHGWKFWKQPENSWANDILESSRKGDIKIEKLEEKFSSNLMNEMWSI